MAIYKGEDIRPFTPLPLYPSDWARPLQANDKRMSKEVARSSSILEQLKKIEKVQRGIVLREVARLNTREHLTATWFEREANQPIAFTHELWRMVLKGNVAEDFGKAVLAIINSKVVAYLINLFSTNNHVVKDDLSRVPIPDKQFMPTGLLSSLADNILREYVKLEQKFVLEYDAKLPEFDDGKVYIPPSSVLAKSHVPKLKVSTLVGLGEVKNKGSANGRIKALKIRNLIVYKEDITNSNKTTLSQVLDLFFSEPKKGDDIWLQALNWQVPDTVAVMDWLREYNTILQQAQTSWETIISLKQQVDDVIADWYGFNDNQRLAINEGLPWARRRKSKDASEKSSLPTEISVQSKLPKGSTNRLPVVSSQIYAIGYDSNTATLEIEFLSGEVWQYQCVSPEIYQAFETSPSKGAYFSKEIKGKFASVKL